MAKLKIKRAFRLVGTPFIVSALVFAVLATQQRTNLRSQAGSYPIPKYLRYSSDSNVSFVVRVSNPEVIKQAENILSGGAVKYPVGRVEKGDGGFNVSDNGYWSWHLDADTVLLKDKTISLCDADPEEIEDDLENWEGKTFCPSLVFLEAILDTPPLP